MSVPLRTTREAEPPDAVLYAVLDDLRHTLGIAWLDPVFRSLATDPIFVVAAWSATRPNVTKSFTESAARLRRQALDTVHGTLRPPDHREFIHRELRTEDADRLVRTVRAMHHGLPKVYLVIQAWARLARRQRIPGTGREEMPARRGIASWQEGVIVPGSAPPDAMEDLVRITEAMSVPGIPSTLLALSPMRTYLDRACTDLATRIGTDGWTSSLLELRRAVTSGIEGFPHPMDLQWDALKLRGLSEDRRRYIADALRDATSVMPVNLLIATFLCIAIGGPEPAGEV